MEDVDVAAAEGFSLRSAVALLSGTIRMKVVD